MNEMMTASLCDGRQFSEFISKQGIAFASGSALLDLIRLKKKSPRMCREIKNVAPFVQDGW